jgi:hypothetical protein
MNKLIGVLAVIVLATGCGEGTLSATQGDLRGSGEQGLLDDANGPNCMDIVAGSGAFDGTAVSMLVQLGKTGCSYGIYTVNVLGADANGRYTVPLAQQTQTADSMVKLLDDQTGLGFRIPVSASKVCVYATTAIGVHAFDRAPDLEGSCVVMTPGAVGEITFN